MAADAVVGLACEVLILTPVAAAYLGLVAARGQLSFGNLGPKDNLCCSNHFSLFN